MTESPADVCAIVGVGPGLGVALARRFGLGGYRLALIARDGEKLAQLTETLGAAHIAAQAFAADAGSIDSLTNAFATIRTTMGDPAVVIYNAVGYHVGGPSELPPETLFADLQVGVIGAAVATHAVLPAMRAHARGTLLFTGGGAAFGPSTDVVTLSVQKAALRNYVLSLAAELAESGLRVATVTVSGQIQAGSHFDPDQIASVYWDLHSGARNEPEVIYR